MAKASRRTKPRVAPEHPRFYVADENELLAAVEEGRRAMREGKVVDHATIAAVFEQISKKRR